MGFQTEPGKVFTGILLLPCLFSHKVCPPQGTAQNFPSPCNFFLSLNFLHMSVFIFRIYFIFINMYVSHCVCMCVCTLMCICWVGALRGQKKASESLELKLQAVVSLLTWCWELNSGPLQGQYLHSSPLPHKVNLI